MSPAQLRTRLRMALRAVDTATQAELLQLAIALPEERVSLPIPAFRTPAGAKTVLALLVRASFGNEPVRDVDGSKIDLMVETLRNCRVEA